MSLATMAADAPATTGSHVARNDALDFTKGSLVLFMVLYHWLNYFIVLDWDVYRYLRFITTSFIFITGFLISNIYLAKYSPLDSRLHTRLLARGVKLLLLFTALNVAAALVISRNGGIRQLQLFFENSFAIYVTGNGRAAFDVLVPIAYSLILSPLVLMAAGVFRFSLHALAATALILAAVTSGTRSASINVELVAIAMFGMMAGTIPLGRLHRWLDRPVLLIAGYVLYLWAISVWNILFPLQVIGVSLSLSLLYVLARACATGSGLSRIIISLGKYSLLAYVVHVFVLQVLRGFRGELNGPTFAAPLIATLVVTIVTIELVNAARSRSSSIDRLYRVVFA